MLNPLGKNSLCCSLLHCAIILCLIFRESSVTVNMTLVYMRLASYCKWSSCCDKTILSLWY